MSWRSAMRRTRQRPRNTLANSDSWNNNTNKVTEAPNDSNQIGMHVRVLRYHEIRLGNIEKQLAKLSRQLSSFPSSVKQRTNVKNKSDTAAENTGPVNQLQGVLKNLAEEVASSNKMIKQFEIDPTICLRTHSRVINDFSYYEYLPIKKRRLIKNFASSFDCETGKYMNKNSRFEYIEVYPIPKLDKHVVFTSTKPGNCEWFRERGFSRYPKILFSHYYTYVRII